MWVCGNRESFFDGVAWVLPSYRGRQLEKVQTVQEGGTSYRGCAAHSSTAVLRCCSEAGASRWVYGAHVVRAPAIGYGRSVLVSWH